MKVTGFPAEKAELFNDYFCSVFTSSRQDNSLTLQSYPRMNIQISEITLSFNEVRNCLSNLDPSKATGPDGIPARILKNCSEQIADRALFNYSVRVGRFPSDWKSADITPVHKKDLP